MKKIPALFARDPDDPRILTRTYHQLADWVVAGEGFATRKWDGTAVLWAEDKLWARYDAKKGKEPPSDFRPAQEEPDPITGHYPGWVPATRPEDKWIREALINSGLATDLGVSWTYEAVGPKIGGNHERVAQHKLIPHGWVSLIDAPRDYDGLMDYFNKTDFEGIVWWRDLSDINCDKVKITGAALGIPRSIHFKIT